MKKLLLIPFILIGCMPCADFAESFNEIDGSKAYHLRYENREKAMRKLDKKGIEYETCNSWLVVDSLNFALINDYCTFEKDKY